MSSPLNKYTVFLNNEVYAVYPDFRSMDLARHRLPEEAILFRRTRSATPNPWVNKWFKALIEEDIDPVVRMLALILNL